MATNPPITETPIKSVSDNITAKNINNDHGTPVGRFSSEATVTDPTACARAFTRQLPEPHAPVTTGDPSGA